MLLKFLDLGMYNEKKIYNSSPDSIPNEHLIKYYYLTVKQRQRLKRQKLDDFRFTENLVIIHAPYKLARKGGPNFSCNFGFHPNN